MTDKVVVVTGSEGFLGRKVVARLAADGHSIVAVDRVAHAGDTLPGVVHHQSDLSDPATLTPCTLDSFTLVHLAWDMRRYQGYGIQAGQVRQFADLLDYWGQHGLQRAVVMGSAEEYGGSAGILSETSAPRFPLSPYGWAKRAARDLALSWCERTGHPVTWLRPFIMYGPGQKGDMVIPFAIESARLRRKAEMTDGLQQRDFVYIDDVADAVALAATREAEGWNEFNLGRGEGVRVADMVRTIAAHFGAEDYFNLGARPRRLNEPDVQVADCSRAAASLGWKAKVDWREGLERTLSGIS
ncbi:MAG TPA: NAD(P)-dependent oxidoreductase [Kiritimatiellia bacterium]|mgnify:CR=1 FL=1|nr:NAD(P)-dependent oxidoreductase [Kiritimatiellia bacterium]HMP34386.1 NAD(P)-dependent oxidoreductase [Kiritimatiellia bacterium]